MADLKFSIAWDAYQKNICNGLSLLQQKGEFVDMTLAADGHHVKVHQMIMSLVSPYIKELITSAHSPHPVIFLNKVSYQTLLSILEYAYTGEVMVARERLCEFLEACNSLHIRGLESNSVKTNGDGDLLSLLGARGFQDEEPIEKPQTKDTEKLTPIRHGIKRKKLDIHEDDEEIYEDETYLIDESQMDDSALDDIDETEDKVLVYKEPNDSFIKMETSQTKSSIIQYSLSCQGSIQLVLNRYIYCMRHTRKNNERMWRCTDYNKSQCRAYAVTRGDMVLERGCAHNHPFHDKQVLKRVRSGNMYTAFNAVESVALLNKKTKPSIDENKEEDAKTLL